MSLAAPEAERTALERIAPLLQAEGYEVIAEPGPADLPSFLADRRPDAIAVGKRPSLLVEVFRKDGTKEAAKISELRSLVKERDDWELRIFYFSSLEPTLSPVPNATAAATIQAARDVLATDPRAAILFAWSILEAVAREKIETAGPRPLNPNALVNLLASEGYLDREQAREMFRLSELRSRVAHGQIDCAATSEDVLHLLSIAESIGQDRKRAVRVIPFSRAVRFICRSRPCDGSSVACPEPIPT